MACSKPKDGTQLDEGGFEDRAWVVERGRIGPEMPLAPAGEDGDQASGVEGLEELAPVGFVIASREGRGERRRGTWRDVDRFGGGGAARDEADGDALQGAPLPGTLTPGPSPASGRGVNSGGCEMPEPGGGGGLGVTWVETLALDGDAGLAKNAKPAVSSGAPGPGLA
jgi:hypothetical protein